MQSEFSPIFAPKDTPLRSGWYVAWMAADVIEAAHADSSMLYDDILFYWFDSYSEIWYKSNLMIRELQEQHMFWFGTLVEHPSWYDL